MWRVAFCPFPCLHGGLIESGESGIYFDFCTLNQKGACFIPKRVGCWTGGQKLSQSALCVLPPLFRYSSCRMSGNLLPSPRPPWSFFLWDLQDLSPEPEMQVSDRTRTLFKAVSGAALKSCSDRLTAQNTQSAVGSWGSHFLSRRSSLQSHRLWICSPALGDRRRINSYGRSAKCHLR